MAHNSYYHYPLKTIFSIYRRRHRRHRHHHHPRHCHSHHYHPHLPEKVPLDPNHLRLLVLTELIRLNRI